MSRKMSWTGAAFGWTGEPETDGRRTSRQANPQEKQVIDEEMKKKASAFYEYINKIDLDDFGKRQVIMSEIK